MAIIDTSKGVRPCVEELAVLENLKESLVDIEPVFTYSKNHDLFDYYDDIRVINGITIKNNKDGSFTVSGIATSTVYVGIMRYLQINIEIYEDIIIQGFPTNSVPSNPVVFCNYQSREIPNFNLKTSIYMYDNAGVARSSTPVIQTPTLTTLLIRKSYLPISEFGVSVSLSVPQNMDLTEPITVIPCMYNLTNDIVDVNALFKNAFLSADSNSWRTNFPYASGLVEKTNLINYENYLYSNGVIVDTSLQGVKRYHDSE